jgi:hypothetical protein
MVETKPVAGYSYFRRSFLYLFSAAAVWGVR